MASLISSPFTLPTTKVENFSSISQKQFFLHSFLPKKANQVNSKSSLKVKCAIAGNGLFTQTSPEVRRIVPNNEQGLPTVKIVYVVLEAQYQSSLSEAVRTLNSSGKYASFQVVGYLVEELRDKETYKTFCQDVKDANIFIGSLIFVEELALKVKAAVETERDRLDAVLVFPSMPEVMRLNKLGSFSMSQLGQSKSPFFQLFKNKKSSSAGFADQMLKLVRTLPKVLKYLPSDKAQDARLYILSLQFWLGGSPDNLVNFVKMISGSYVPALKSMKIEYSDPVLFLDNGIWHPLAPCMYDDVKEYLNWYGTRRDANEKLKSPNAPVVGLVLQRSHIVTGDESHYVAVIMELEARGAKVIPIFAGGLDFSGPVEKYFIDPISKKPFVNSVISLTGFALVGGPARQDHPRAIEALMKLDVPYIVALPLVFQTTEEWLNSTLGLHPIQVSLQVALPELDGGMEPIVFSGRDPRTGKSHALHKRVEQLCTRAINWANLKKKPKEKHAESDGNCVSLNIVESSCNAKKVIVDLSDRKSSAPASSKKKNRKGGLSMFLNGALDNVPKEAPPPPPTPKNEGPAWGGASISKGSASLREILQDEQGKTKENKASRKNDLREDVSDVRSSAKLQLCSLLTSNPIPVVSTRTSRIPEGDKSTPPWASSGTPPLVSRPSLRGIQLQQGKQQQGLSHSPKTRTTGFSVTSGQGPPSDSAGSNRWFKPEGEMPSSIRSIQIEEKAIKDLKRFYSSVKVVKNQS